MKCSLCQTVVEPGTEICPNCTANIIVDESPVAAQGKAKSASSKTEKASEPLSKTTKIIVAVASVLVVGAAGVFGIPKLLNRSSTPENFADPAAVFKYLAVDCALAQPQTGTDAGTGSAYTIVTCGKDYFALTMAKAADATASAAIASAQMPDTYHMYTLANSIIVATTAVSDKLVEAHPELVVVK
jgi:hypothetical protein